MKLRISVNVFGSLDIVLILILGRLTLSLFFFSNKSNESLKIERNGEFVKEP